MPRKGTATVKTPSKDDKYTVVDSDSNEVSAGSTASSLSNSAVHTPDSEDPHGGKRPEPVSAAVRQPRQAHTQPSPPPHPRTTSPHNAPPTPGDANRVHGKGTQPARPAAPVQPPRQSRTPPRPRDAPSADMAAAGSYIPPSQQRHMRACMVCSIVRTHQQFLQQGCPNCEDLLELVGNPDQINDCTSQVYEGLITVADTKRSWVARYQRLEGYVPGVYATQVEGILPEDVIGAVENAGINYVPRDGSEQEMLPKD